MHTCTYMHIRCQFPPKQKEFPDKKDGTTIAIARAMPNKICKSFAGTRDCTSFNRNKKAPEPFGPGLSFSADSRPYFRRPQGTGISALKGTKSASQKRSGRSSATFDQSTRRRR